MQLLTHSRKERCLIRRDWLVSGAGLVRGGESLNVFFCSWWLARAAMGPLIESVVPVCEGFDR